jgi:hypothetical protein
VDLPSRIPVRTADFDMREGKNSRKAPAFNMREGKNSRKAPAHKSIHNLRLLFLLLLLMLATI